MIEKNKDLTNIFITIIGLFLLPLFIVLGYNLIETVENKQITQNNNFEYDNFWDCENSMQQIEKIEYNLFTYHNLTCEKINFILSNWDSEIVTELDQVKLFGNTYKKVDYGVHKTLHLKKLVSISKPTIENCSVTSSTYTDIYRRQDFLNIYLERC